MENGVTRVGYGGQYLVMWNEAFRDLAGHHTLALHMSAYRSQTRYATQAKCNWRHVSIGVLPPLEMRSRNPSLLISLILSSLLCMPTTPSSRAARPASSAFT